MAGAAHQRRAGRRERRKVVMAPKAPDFPAKSGEGGIRTLERGLCPSNALAGRRLQPLGHFSVPAQSTHSPGPLPCAGSEGWQSGRMRRSRKPLRASGSVEGSNPSPSAPPVDLPHDLGLYFEFPPGTRIVPVRDLYPMKPPDSQPASVAVALARMADAAAGRISRRAPLRVRLRSDGCFDVVDGNATYAAARELGWPELPVLVEPASE